MALKIDLKLEGVPSDIDKVTYVVIKTNWVAVEDGVVNVDDEGQCRILLSTDAVSEFEKVLVVTTDYDGNNYETAGNATDFIDVSEVYKDFSIKQKKYIVECDNRTLAYTPWDMGDGVIVNEEDPVYIYLKNGTYTITNLEFTQEVVIEGVVPFDVSLSDNVITCTKQTGFDEVWLFGNGDFSEDKNPTHKYYENGVYVVSYGRFSKEIVLDYYTDMIADVAGNVVTFFRPSGGSDEIDYGDGFMGMDLVHEYPQHGIFEPKIGNLNGVVTIKAVEMPTVSINTINYNNEVGLFEIAPVGTGVSLVYKVLVNGEVFNLAEGETITYDFNSYGGGIYPISITATDIQGNIAKATKNLNVQLENVAPTLVINEPIIDKLKVLFSAEGQDTEGESLSYYWTLGNESGTGDKATFEYEYLVEGTYTVTCTVTDDRSPSMSTTESIEITVSEFLQFDGDNILSKDNPQLVAMEADVNNLMNAGFRYTDVSFANNVMTIYSSTAPNTGRVEVRMASLGLVLDQIYNVSFRIKSDITSSSPTKIDYATAGLVLQSEVDGEFSDESILELPNDGEYHDVSYSFKCADPEGTLRINSTATRLYFTSLSIK